LSSHFNFYSSSYDWLVVAGDTARFKGIGTINGVGSFGFQFWAQDADSDAVRIKIWDGDSGQIVYDNAVVDPMQPINGGSIKIRVIKKKRAR